MSATTSAVAEKQETIVSRFANLMGTPNDASGNLSAPSKDKELLSCFASSLKDEAVVCTLPSLDMRLSEDGEDPLPAVGEHMQTDDNSSNSKKRSSSGSHPVMEASVISSAADASATAARMEQKAAQRLCTMTSWTKSSIIYAPGALSKNVSSSFSSLVGSRVRSWTLLMFRHSLSSGDSSSRSRLLSMLSASIKINSSVSTFKTLPLPDSCKGQSKEADVILPLLYEVVLEVSLQDRTDSVTLRAPGTISAFFDTENPAGIKKVDIRLDSGALLGSMVDQARLSVFKTVAKVTAAEVKPGAPLATEPNKPSAGAGLSGFSSSLRLSGTATSGSPRLEKARSSALRLNSVLHGTTGGKDSVAGLRKQRSVQWDQTMELPSIKSSVTENSNKRPRISQTTTRLKSFKSFGRPHAEDTGSGPRNATFGDFGRKPVWGRDGRLANHPQPQNSLERSRQDVFGDVKVTGGVNATFGSPAPAPSASLRGNNVANGLGGLPSSLPRTATALESWLMNATGSSK